MHDNPDGRDSKKKNSLPNIVHGVLVLTSLYREGIVSHLKLVSYCSSSLWYRCIKYLCFLEGNSCLETVDACEISGDPLFGESPSLPSNSAASCKTICDII